ncbi:unnamed protein product [Heligmosomoides polygyrus]|uniref:Uncharacterized protein n=1 Tax=Heligmosomoides polygyrus TaxID=6339 RepID=A0A3P7Y794_HELPZ|nr:unnamed protein product [Heligmosomoides polygyrus]
MLVCLIRRASYRSFRAFTNCSDTSKTNSCGVVESAHHRWRPQKTTCCRRGTHNPSGHSVCCDVSERDSLSSDPS